MPLGHPLVLLSQLLVLLLLACHCHSYGRGAPNIACSNLTPGHGNPPQPTAEFPYLLEVSPNSVRPGSRVSLTISSSVPDTDPIKGFLVQVRDAHSPSSSPPSGQFVDIDAQHKPLDCGGPASAITHSSNEPKQRVSVTWEAPADLDRDVVFLVSVVQQFDTFWVGEQSDTVKLASEPTPEPGAEPEPQPESEPGPSAGEDDDDDDDDDGRGTATSARVGTALLVVSLAMAVFHRLQ